MIRTHLTNSGPKLRYGTPRVPIAGYVPQGVVQPGAIRFEPKTDLIDQMVEIAIYSGMSVSKRAEVSSLQLQRVNAKTSKEVIDINTKLKAIAEEAIDQLKAKEIKREKHLKAFNSRKHK